MATEPTLEDVSAWLDGEHDAVAPLTPDAAAFRDDALALRRRFRVAVAETPPDVTDAVLARIGEPSTVSPSRRHPSRWARAAWLGAAAATVLALVAVVALRDRLSGDAGPSAGDGDDVTVQLGRELLAAQFEIEELAGDVTVVERGAHPAVPERRYEGHVRYVAPERFELSIVDATDYPAGGWVANDVEVVVAGDVAWSRALRSCPVATQPACLGPAPEVIVTRDREPFSERQAAPLDVVVPLGSIPSDAVATDGPGDAELTVETTIGRAGPLVDGLVGVGNWRRFHRTDIVRIGVDADDLTLRSLAITPATGDDRTRWALLNGYVDSPGDVLLDLTITADRPGSTDRGLGAGSPPPPPRGRTDDVSGRSDGFTDSPPASLSLPVATVQPAGLELHRTGALGVDGAPGIEVAAWADGRGWLKARWTRSWSEDRLFGRPGELVRPVDLGPGGVGYLDPESGRLAVHADGVDLVLMGTVGLDAQADLVAGLGVVGVTVPPDWREAAVVGEVPDGLLSPPGPVTVRVDGDVVRVGVAAPGTGGYVLTQSPTAALPPPASGEVHAVSVRGVIGRYSPGLGELEWIEGGRLVSMRSVDLGVDELVAAAGGLVPGAAVPLAPPRTGEPGSGPTVLLAWTSGGLPDGAPAAISAAFADSTVVAGGQLDLVGSSDVDGVAVDAPPPGWAIPLDALAVDPATYPYFVSPRAAPALAALRPGQAVLTETSALLRGLGPGSVLVVGDGEPLTVAGVIDDVSGAAAEVVVSSADAERLGIATPRYALVAGDGPREELEARVAATIGSGPVRFRAPAETPFLRHGDAVLPQLEVKRRFGEFAYRDAGARDIEIEPAWVRANIVAVDGTFGAALCHRAVADLVGAVIDELRLDGKLALARSDPAAGCWVPRRIGPGETISRHAWGIAVDVNPSTNPDGAYADQDARLVEAFRRHGFTWGGDWLEPDPSHFEFVTERR